MATVDATWLCLGIDLGTTSLKISVVDATGNEIYEASNETRAHTNALNSSPQRPRASEADIADEQDVRAIWKVLLDLLSAIPSPIASRITVISRLNLTQYHLVLKLQRRTVTENWCNRTAARLCSVAVVYVSCS